MRPLTRREFLHTTALLTASTFLDSRPLLASPFGLPLGLQLYSVRDLLPADYQGTLKQVAAAGYKEVEAAGFFHHTAYEVKSDMRAAGLRCVSAHYSLADLQPRLKEIIAFHRELGVHFIICASPHAKDPVSAKGGGPLTLDDWHWNAEQFNTMGEKVKAAGMQFGYHNHVAEFHKLDGVTPYDELLRLTHPDLVTFEMDCGWVSVGGGDPAEYLRQHPTRISMLHVKDFKRSDHPASLSAPPQAAELGQGTVDFKAIFEAAHRKYIKHYFVEQEEFNIPAFEALKIDADYMKNLRV